MTDAETVAYFSAIARKPESWQRADWGSAEGQRLRWQIIADELGHRAGQGATVLDVGCGDGGLERVLPPDLQYTGWDLLRGQDIMRPPAGAKFDWVVASGLWTYRDVGWAQDAISQMWNLCRAGVIVNSLSRIGRARDTKELHLHPADFLTWGFALTPHVALRHDYWPGDMTLVLTR